MIWWGRARLVNPGVWIFLAGWLLTFVDSTVRFSFPTLAGGHLASVPVSTLSATVAVAGWASTKFLRARERSVGTARLWIGAGDIGVLGAASLITCVCAGVGVSGPRAAYAALLFGCAMAVAVSAPSLTGAWLIVPGGVLLFTMLTGFDSQGRTAAWAIPVMDKPTGTHVVVICLCVTASLLFYGVDYVRRAA